MHSRIDDLQLVIQRMAMHRKQKVQGMARQLPGWEGHLSRQKAIFAVLNMFNYDLTRKVLIAEAWCPAAECEVTQRALRRASERSGAQVPPIMNIIGEPIDELGPIGATKEYPIHRLAPAFTESRSYSCKGLEVSRCK